MLFHGRIPSRRSLLALLVLALFLLVSACNLPSTAPPVDANAIYTQAAQTVAAQLTQGAPTQAAPGQATQPSGPDVTATPSEIVVQPSPTLPPTDVPVLPTNTPLPAPTNTPVPAPTNTPLPCDWAEFVRDITIPDGTEFAAGTPFTKTWRLRNIGSCTWTSDYRLVFFNGEDMGDVESVRLGREVEPGETIDVSVNLVAPDDPGTYRSNWKLRSEDGRFGIGDRADGSFYVEIEVVNVTSGVVYNFVRSYCAAYWQTRAGQLECPGEEGDRDGFVIYLDDPDLENRNENEPALWVQPDRSDNTWISGYYPDIPVKAGDRFVADVGCLDDAGDCDVIFQLNYRIGNGSVQTLAQWREVFDESITRVNEDLTPLAGKNVEFILTVLSNGPSRGDAAFWLMPHIYR